MIRSRTGKLGPLVAFIAAVALLFLSTAHRPVSAASGDAALVAYLALGGTLDELCGPGGDDNTDGAHRPCPACTLAKSLIDAPPVEWVLTDVTVRPADAAPVRPADAPQSRPASPPARGPPLSVTA